MSSGSSVASQSDASGVHMMEGGANSVASSSAMSSSDNRENVFDRVLNMVMAEEHERLNAMGMSTADPKSDYARVQRGGSGDARDGPTSAAAADRRFSRADAAAQRAVSSDYDLGLLPPGRGDLSPIDMDTGLEMWGSDGASGPIDMDTGMEVGASQHFGSLHHRSPIDMDSGLEIQCGGEGGDCEYHDLNDDGMDERQWKKLNAKALMEGVNKGMKSLKVDSSRRVRSYDSSGAKRQPPLVGHAAHNSFGSDPRGYRRSGSDSDDCRGNDKIPKKSPSRKVGAEKASKKFWEKDKDFESDEWVAFDNHGPPSGGRTTQDRVSDLAAF